MRSRWIRAALTGALTVLVGGVSAGQAQADQFVYLHNSAAAAGNVIGGRLDNQGRFRAIGGGIGFVNVPVPGGTGVGSNLDLRTLAISPARSAGSIGTLVVTSRDSISTFAIRGNGDLQFLAENDLIIPGITHANAVSVHTQTFAPDFHVYVSTTPNPDVFVPPGEDTPIGNPEVRGFDLDPATGTLTEFGGAATGFDQIPGDPPHFAAAMTNVGNRFLAVMNTDFAGDQDDAISVFSFDPDGNLTLVTAPPVTFGGDSGLVKNLNGTNSLFVPDQQGNGVFNIRLDEFGTPTVFAPPAQTLNGRYLAAPTPPASVALSPAVLAVVSDISFGAVMQSFSLRNFGLALPQVIVPPAKSTFGAFPAFGQGYNIAHFLANDGGSSFLAVAGGNVNQNGQSAGELRIMKVLSNGQLQLIFPKKVINNPPQFANPFIRPLGFGVNASGLVSIKP